MGVIAFQAFMAEKTLPSENRVNRLYIKDDELRYDDNAGCMTLFAAKLGFGDASMSNISKFINQNRVIYLTDNSVLTDFNAYIDSYNDKQSIFWKKAKKIKEVANGVIKTKGQEVKLVPIPEVDMRQKDGMHKLVKAHLANCNSFLNDSNFEDNFEAFLESCELLNYSLENWDTDKKNVTKEEKKTFNDLLTFKNTARRIVFEAKKKALKGTVGAYNPLPTVAKDKKAGLKSALKNISKNVLTKYFHERLELDGAKLAELRQRYEENKGILQEPVFLEEQLDRWARKLEQGKPIAIPKWYHATGKSGTNQEKYNVLCNILNTHLLYASGGYPGVFASSRPEVTGVGDYGDYCLVMSERLEKVGTKDPRQSGTLYPRHSCFNGKIEYSDQWQAPLDNDFKNNQNGVKIWLGFPRGATTLVFGQKYGTEGVPIERIERIKDGALKYYRDTTLCCLFHVRDTPALIKLGQENRVQVVTYKQIEAMRTLIKGTFICTLPADWKDKLWSF